MTLAPLVSIIERELRVASRRGTTYWTRLGVAAAAVLITSASILVFEVAARAGASISTGSQTFLALRTFGFAAALAGGIFLASDAVAEERRDGTLGLLLLTGLSPGHVVLGKALVAVLRGAQWLLAAIPLAGMTLLLGGVTAGEFGGLAIALANALVWSVAVSLLASACVQHGTGTILLSLTLLLAGLMLPSLMEWSGVPRAVLASPWQAVVESRALHRPAFWISVGLVQLQACICLALATARVRRSPDASSASQTMDSRVQQVRFGSAARRRRVRRRWMDPNPVRWLAMRELWFRWLLNGMALLMLGALAVLGIFADVDILFGIAPMVGSLLGFLVTLHLSSQASRFFAETARNGFLELMVISPLDPSMMIKGQLWALTRAVFIPAIFVFVMPLVQWANMTLIVLPSIPTGAGTNMLPIFQAQMLSALLKLLVYPLSLAALSLTGLLMGLRWQRPLRAFVMTVGLGWLAPAFAVGISSAISVPLILMAPKLKWVLGAVPGVIGIVIYGGIACFVLRYLHRHFADLATGTRIRAATVTATLPPMLPPPLVRVGSGP